jgi:bis(5'-nucleosyl)-tetraphosphatase (symmetrical)
LLQQFDFDAKRDRIWFTGDLVNRGSESLEVLRFVMALGKSAVTVLGNHDLHLLALAGGFAKKRDDDTLDDILNAPDCAALLTWLRTRPMVHQEDEYFLVHAGLLPSWSVDQAQDLGAEVEEVLHGKHHEDFLQRLYGSKPDRWFSGLRGIDRLRVIVNAMTRLRFCTADGVMDFSAKGETSTAPAGFMPWFEIPGRASADASVIFGHWSALGLMLRPNLLALDSGCVWGAQLTAVRLEDRKVFQCACA